MKHLCVDVAGLLEHPGKEQYYSGQVALKSIKLGDELVEFPKSFQVRVHLLSTHGGIVVQGCFEGNIRLRCSRCLEKYDLSIRPEIKELAAKGEFEDEEIFPIKEGKIDLTAIVYQNALIEAPIRPLCSDNCGGLCDICGENLNKKPHRHVNEHIDERMLPLREFFKKNSG